MPRKKSQPIDESYTPEPVVEQDEEVQEVAMDVEPEPEVKSVDPEPEAPKAREDKAVIFRTREPESVAFQIRVGANKVRGGRNMHDGFVYWRVPAAFIDVFRQTPHVLSGRIVEEK